MRALLTSPLGLLVGVSLGALGGGGSILAVPALLEGHRPAAVLADTAATERGAGTTSVQRGRDVDAGLSPRELEVLCLLVAGQTDREIAEALFISRRTVDNHISNLLAKLDVQPRYVLTDGFPVAGLAVPGLAMWKGDQVAACIAAASVIAKVTRDRIMTELHEHWPQYDFATHKGYVTPEHQRALTEHGPSPVHRRSYVNVARAAAGAPVDAALVEVRAGTGA